MSATPPPGGASAPQAYPPPREGRPVSFYVAVFLALLLLVSGALNLLLLVVSAFGATSAGIGSSSVVDDSGHLYELVAVDGDADARDSILRVKIEGAIAELASPVLGAPGGTVSQVRRALRAAEREPTIKAVLFDINSPGGGVTDSDECWRLITEFRAAHPDIATLALFGDIAASGGYYIAVACDAIVARPTTITGSIGVIINSWNVAGALDKIGVEAVTIVSPDTPYKDMLSPYRPVDDAEAAKIRAIVQEMYERFVDVVDRGRPELTRGEVKAAATGEIYSAQRAFELGLVDAVGDWTSALARLREAAGIGSARIVEYRRVPTLFDTLFGVQAAAPSLDDAIAGLLRSSSGPKLLYYWAGGR